MIHFLKNIHQLAVLLREMASPQLVANSDLIWHVSTLGQFWPGWVLNRPILAWLGIFFFDVSCHYRVVSCDQNSCVPKHHLGKYEVAIVGIERLRRVCCTIRIAQSYISKWHLVGLRRACAQW